MRRFAPFFLLPLLAVSVLAQGDKKKQTTTKPKPATPAKTSAKPKTTGTAKPKPSATPGKKTGEKADWEKASTEPDATARVAALKAFVEKYPRSTHLVEASTLIVKAEAGLGNEKLAASDIPAAFEFFKSAVADAQAPIPADVYTEVFSKFASNLFFRGGREEGIEIARLLVPKIQTNAAQLLDLATFYMSIEDGSEAKNLASAALMIDPNATAYQTLGLASRIDFQFDEAAAAYAKAVEVDPGSIDARRGLAEMRRTFGRADEAAELYRQILTKDDGYTPAQTGLVLALFEAGKRSEAEAELTKALAANADNVILLAGAAYWYAAHNEYDQAVAYAQRAVAADPRFIWSHIALARGLLGQRNAVAAERTLLAARRYGNFPTLEYEIASARLALGFYREAAEGLSKSFAIKDGVISTKLGGRVPRESRDFSDLIGYERRASIFAPTAADSPENSLRLTALLALETELSAKEPNADAVSKAVDNFVRGDDKMRLYRQLFAASQLLEKKVALPKVQELMKSAPSGVDAGLGIGNASVAVMAGELYDNRRLADVRGEYINVPEVPRLTLSSIVRGQIEEYAGIAALQSDDANQAVIRLRRAVGVLPVDSAWWRSSTWQLGTALARTGNDAEALDNYIKSYKSSGPNLINYGIIESLYTKVHGSTDGLEAKIGAKPVPIITSEAVAKNAEPTPAVTTAATAATTATPEISAATPAPTETPKTEPSAAPTTDATPLPTPSIAATPEPTASVTATPPIEIPKPEPTLPPATPTVSPTPEEVKATPTPLPTAEATPVQPSPKLDETATNTGKPLFPPVVITIPPPPSSAKTPEARPESTPAAEQAKATPDASPLATPEVKPEAKPEASPAPPEVKTTPEVKPETTPAQPEAKPTPDATPDLAPESKSPDPTTPSDGRPRIVEVKPEPKPCTITLSEETVNLQIGGGDLAVIVGLADDGDLAGLTAASLSPADVGVRREPIGGVSARALYVIRALGEKPGMYQVHFELPCGKKDLFVHIR